MLLYFNGLIKKGHFRNEKKLIYFKGLQALLKYRRNEHYLYISKGYRKLSGNFLDSLFIYFNNLGQKWPILLYPPQREANIGLFRLKKEISG